MPLMISFSDKGLLAKQQEFVGLDDLIGAALKKKLPIVLDLSKKAISAGDKAIGAQNDRILLRGQRISPGIDLVRLSVRLGICLPFLAKVQQIVLPPYLFATFGRPHRPMGDFFMRNFFNAALRKKVTFGSAAADSSKQSRDLQRCYSWMLKAYISDALLHETDPAARFLKACHFDIGLGDSPFFSKAALEVRQQHMKRSVTSKKSPDLGSLLGLRSKLMAELP